MDSNKWTSGDDRKDILAVNSTQFPMATAPQPPTYCLPDGKEITVWMALCIYYYHQLALVFLILYDIFHFPTQTQTQPPNPNPNPNPFAAHNLHTLCSIA